MKPIVKKKKEEVKIGPAAQLQNLTLHYLQELLEHVSMNARIIRRLFSGANMIKLFCFCHILYIDISYLS